jgi:hypothetical protein
MFDSLWDYGVEIRTKIRIRKIRKAAMGLVAPCLGPVRGTVQTQYFFSLLRLHLLLHVNINIKWTKRVSRLT